MMTVKETLYNCSSCTREEFFAHLVDFLDDDFELLKNAYELSKSAHARQERRTGGRYFEHPKQVAKILLELGVRDPVIIAAALLHDFLEDTYALDEWGFGRLFGERALRIVRLATCKGIEKAEYFAHLADADEPGVWLVKCSDRLHNLITLECGNDEHGRRKRAEQVAETREYVLPLAVRLANDQEYAAFGVWFIEQLTGWCDTLEARG